MGCGRAPLKKLSFFVLPGFAMPGASWLVPLDLPGSTQACLVETFEQHDVALGQLPVAVKNPSPIRRYVKRSPLWQKRVLFSQVEPGYVFDTTRLEIQKLQPVRGRTAIHEADPTGNNLPAALAGSNANDASLLSTCDRHLPHRPV